MVILSVLYPKSQSSYFDHEYYLTKHIPLVRERLTPLGLKDVTLARGTASLDDSPPPFELIGLLAFPTAGDAAAALQTHGAEIIGDIPNFTNIQPSVQMNEQI